MYSLLGCYESNGDINDPGLLLRYPETHWWLRRIYLLRFCLLLLMIYTSSFYWDINSMSKWYCSFWTPFIQDQRFTAAFKLDCLGILCFGRLVELAKVLEKHKCSSETTSTCVTHQELLLDLGWCHCRITSVIWKKFWTSMSGFRGSAKVLLILSWCTHGL